jgi:uncharacterized protein (TIGR03437 family)
VGTARSLLLPGTVQNGADTTSVGGYQVLLKDTPVPLLYADSGQINAVVPGAVYGSISVQVVTPSGTIVGPTLPVNYSPVPGIFQTGKPVSPPH